MICLREPSLGPCMGIKGGAAGGGYSQVVPMEDINLHFTGDLHAITAAHNLLAAMVDNHIQQGNELNIDPRRVVWNRVMDMNDRVLRHIVVGLGGHANGVLREGGFDITVASEVMAILCLADSIHDMKERFARIIVGYTYDNKPVTAGDIHAQGAMTALMKDALKPNLVQTLNMFRPSFTAARLPISLTDATLSWQQEQLCILLITSLRKQDSVLTLAQKNSWTSSAVSQVSNQMLQSSSLPSVH